MNFSIRIPLVIAVLLFTAFFPDGASASVTVGPGSGLDGVYDSTTNTNKVDFNASGNALSSTGQNDVAGFTTAVATAFASNRGGVINFDAYVSSSSGTFPSGDAGPITVNLNSGGTEKLNVALDHTFNWQTSSNITGISGSTGNFLFNPTAGNPSYTFTFGALTGGAIGEAVTQAGVTVLSRNGVSGAVTGLATFSDGSMSSVLSATIAGTNAAADTFYGFTAPAGLSITSMTLTYGNSGDLRRGFDDFGFITSVVAVPEPSTAFAGGLCALLAVRRICRRRS